MQSSDLLFVAGDVQRLASIKIRCEEIAEQLGCACWYRALNAKDVPRGYKAYLCVKPDFGIEGVIELAKHGSVIWDILDDDPPTESVDLYIASTIAVKNRFAHLGKIAVIPHHHCNTEGVPNNAHNRAAAYLGSIHWYPSLTNVLHDRYFVDRWSRAQVVDAYRKIGIAINHRNVSIVDEKFITCKTDIKPVAGKHIAINSGIKLINCLGFGIPSVCAVEPAYLEIAPNCTIFCNLSECEKAVEALTQDFALYNALRQECLKLAPKYHITQIIRQYCTLLDEFSPRHNFFTASASAPGTYPASIRPLKNPHF